MSNVSEAHMLISGKPLTIYLSLLFSIVATAVSGAPLNDADDVGNYIFITRYDQTYGSGTLAKDWCLNIEHDSITKDWWYMEPPTGPIEPVAIYKAVRIPTYYVENNKLKIASILIGVGYDRLVTSQYSSGPGSATIAPPGATIGDCFDVGAFIESHFLPYTFGIDPTKPPIETAVNKLDRSVHYVYWRFRDVSHRVYGVTKIPFTLELSGTVVNTYLLVGYGGGAGP
jgi:hypothetical protein